MTEIDSKKELTMTMNQPTFGQESKVSDTGLRLIDNFFGDNNDMVEEDHSFSLRCFLFGSD